MRMLNVDPSLLCLRHLLREHRDLHGLMRLADSDEINPYIASGFVEVHNLVARHDAVVAEMTARTMSHMDDLSERDVRKFKPYQAGEVDTDAALDMLRESCPDCRGRIGVAYDKPAGRARVHDSTSRRRAGGRT